MRGPPAPPGLPVRTASTSPMKASTTRGSNWVPRQRASSVRAAAGVDRVAEHAGPRHRVVRVGDGHDPRAEPDDVAAAAVRIAQAVEPLVRVADDRGRRGEVRDASRPAWSPRSGCVRMSRCSSAVSGAGLRRTASGMASLPRSCSSAPCSTISISAGVSCSARAQSRRPAPPRGRRVRRRRRSSTVSAASRPSSDSSESTGHALMTSSIVACRARISSSSDVAPPPRVRARRGASRHRARRRRTGAADRTASSDSRRRPGAALRPRR